MSRFLLVRTGGILVTLLMVVTFTFALTFAVPRDPARSVVGPKATDEQVAFVRDRLGLDDAIHVQFARYVGNVAQGDLGYSYSQRRSVTAILLDRLPYTMLLAVAAIGVQLVVGIPLGLLSAARSGGVLDRVGLGVSLLMIALPPFWVGLVLLYLVAYRWGLLPLGGSDIPSGLVLPAITMGLAGAAWTSRVMREAALEVLAGDSVRALRAKGMPPRTIIFKHCLRSAASPVLTMLAIDFGFFLGGAVLIESVFAWPGLGLTSFQAMQQNDVPLLMGCVIVGSVFVLLLHLAADAARTLVDPRVRL